MTSKEIQVDVADVISIIAEFLGECVARGMQLPFIACGMSPNGSVLALRFTSRDSDPDILAENYEEGGFSLPMTIVVLDQANETSRITIDPTGKTWH
jgi:hypothetical protein